jgi:hypothetical protein
MTEEAFVPEDFEVPAELHGVGFRLEPLGVQHNERDHVAWTSSLAHIRATPGFADRPWPRPMSQEENAGDLAGHADDFAARRGFTYSVLDEQDDVVGCVYIYPDEDGHAAAHVRSWVRADRAHLDEPVWRTVRAWLAERWPFEKVRYAARPPE